MFGHKNITEWKGDRRACRGECHGDVLQALTIAQPNYRDTGVEQMKKKKSELALCMQERKQKMRESARDNRDVFAADGERNEWQHLQSRTAS